MMLNNWIFRWKRMKLDPLLTLYTKINSAWTKNLSVSVKAITLLENMDKNLFNLGVSNGFLDMTPKAHTVKENREIGLYQNIKFLCINGHDQESEMNLWNVVLWEIILFKNLKSIFHFEEWRYAKAKHTVSPTRRELW